MILKKYESNFPVRDSFELNCGEVGAIISVIGPDNIILVIAIISVQLSLANQCCFRLVITIEYVFLG